VVGREVVEPAGGAGVPPVDAPDRTRPAAEPDWSGRLGRPRLVEPEPGPTVAVLSLRALRPPGDDHGGLLEAEDALCAALSAELHQAVLATPRYSSGALGKPGTRRLLTSTRLARPYRVERSGDDPAEVLLVLARDLADAAVLLGVPGWHRLGERVVVHLSSVTEAELRRYPDLLGHLRRRTDALFSGTEMPPLGHLRSDRLTTIAVVPPLLDVLAFAAGARHAERSIDLFAPDGAPPVQHQVLVEWARQHKASYRTGVGQLGAATSPRQRRRDYAALACRSRVFLTNSALFGHRRHAHREAGVRFYEAMAAGCALVGDLPESSRLFAERVAPARPVHLPRDPAHLPGDVAALLAEPARSQALGVAARAAALRGNDVAHRYREIATLAGIPVASAVERRIAGLSAMADELTGSADGDRDPTLDGA
jgi:hypothetical protein